MQDPKKELPAIVTTLCTTRDAHQLEETVNKYFAPNAEFLHPLCTANSRNEILGLFQWYRLASPETAIEISNMMWDTDKSVAVFDVKETLNVWFLPLAGQRGRMVVRLQLRKSNGSYVIVREEDFIHPLDQIGFVATPLVPFAKVYLRLGCLLSNLGACVFRTIGLTSGLKGGSINYTGLMEAAGLARPPVDKMNGTSAKQ